MSDQYTEEEDKLISWFKDNYKNMIIGVIVGTSSVLGYNYYSDNSLNNQYEISLKYESALLEYQDKKYDSVLKLSEELITTDPDNIYTSLINFYAAKIYHDEKNYKQAINILNTIIVSSDSTEVLDIAKIRLARILIFLKKYNEARETILSLNNHMKKSISTELLGDIEYFKNNFKEAKNYYSLSLQNNLTPNQRKIIENKINSIN